MSRTGHSGARRACPARIAYRSRRKARQRDVQLSIEEFGELRLAYAQHLYKAKGRTVDRSFVLTGGWQTDRERGAYVVLTRAQERTDIYVSQEDLDEQGMDAGAIETLGKAIGESRAQQASVAMPRAGVRPSTVTGERRRESMREPGLFAARSTTTIVAPNGLTPARSPETWPYGTLRAQSQVQRQSA